jgi:lipoate-protein ligase A
MAADEVLLEAAATTGIPSLRFYGWSTPTLSLGYFQPAAHRLADPSLANLPYVRRATGGDALVHHHELTYALALPAGLPWQRRGESWIQRMHGVMAAALQHLGVGTACASKEQTLGPLLCFLHQTPCDLLVENHKVAGSAQRKTRGALLQHGAVLLSQSPYTPALPGLRELVGLTESPDRLMKTLLTEFAFATGWHLSPANWTTAEMDRTTVMVAEKYGSAHWNEKR